jgi:hypothetical protein
MSDEKLMPIVAGCKALVLPVPMLAHLPCSSLFNTVVTVVQRCTNSEKKFHNRGDHWYVDSPIVRKLNQVSQTSSLIIKEKFLMRVDGGQFEPEQDEVTKFIPPNLTPNNR